MTRNRLGTVILHRPPIFRKPMGTSNRKEPISDLGSFRAEEKFRPTVPKADEQALSRIC